jgi:hypothetical protein
LAITQLQLPADLFSEVTVVRRYNQSDPTLFIELKEQIVHLLANAKIQ